MARAWPPDSLISDRISDGPSRYPARVYLREVKWCGKGQRERKGGRSAHRRADLSAPTPIPARVFLEANPGPRANHRTPRPDAPPRLIMTSPFARMRCIAAQIDATDRSAMPTI